MTEICLTPAGWYWLPVVVAGVHVTTFSMFYFLDQKKKWWALYVMCIGSVVTFLAAFPFFLAWIQQ